MTHTEWGWEAWSRALVPEEVVAIARDLSGIDDADARVRMREIGRYAQDPDQEVVYAMQFLGSARDFVSGLAAEDRGMVHMIG